MTTKAITRCHSTQFLLCVVLLFITFIFAGCYRHPTISTDATLFQPEKSKPDLTFSDTPSFLVTNPSQPYNRIGTPAVKHGTPASQEIWVNPNLATIYSEDSSFSTEKGSYTNHIYRIHFNRVPFGIFPFNLTAGKNPGLLIILTYNEKSEPILITTVHTCGCYLAFFPTNYLKKELFPSSWPKGRQQVYGIELPAEIRLPPKSEFIPASIVFTLEDETHRINDVFVLRTNQVQQFRNKVEMKLESMKHLYNLPSKVGPVSFFETDGSRKGYVKNNTKILERLLISWWAFDLRVGEDKAFSKEDTSNIPFYTSLKFWARNSSDMKHFAQFLSYWGWKL